jgi:hypothetical protein
MTATLESLLTDDDLGALRAAYDPAAMAAGARGATVAPLPAAAPLVDAIIDTFYSAAPLLPAARREQTLIALMASAPAPAGRTFAIHLYWGLMEGLSLADLAATLLLVGAYAGIDRYTNAAAAVAALVDRALRPALAAGGDALKSGAIAHSIALAFT